MGGRRAGERRRCRNPACDEPCKAEHCDMNEQGHSGRFEVGLLYNLLHAGAPHGTAGTRMDGHRASLVIAIDSHSSFHDHEPPGSTPARPHIYLPASCRMNRSYPAEWRFSSR
jgi:hypothetical protein